MSLGEREREKEKDIKNRNRERLTERKREVKSFRNEHLTKIKVVIYSIPSAFDQKMINHLSISSIKVKESENIKTYFN